MAILNEMALFNRFAFVVIFTATLTATFARSARADYYIHFWEDHRAAEGNFTLGLDLNDYSTSANYSQSGANVTPNGLSSLSRFQPDVSLAYGLSEHISLFARGSYVSEKVNTILSGVDASSSASGLADQTLALDWRVYEASAPDEDRAEFAFDLQLQLDFPGYSNSHADASQLIHLGEASVDLSVGGFLDIPIAQSAAGVFRGLVGVGYTHRSGGYSSAVPISVTAKWEPAHAGLLGGLSFLSNHSLATDGREPPTIDVSTLGSVISGAVNPSLTTLRASVGYRFENFTEVTLAYLPSISGTDAPAGHTVVLGARMTFHTDRSEASHSGAASPAPAARTSPNAVARSSNSGARNQSPKSEEAKLEASLLPKQLPEATPELEETIPPPVPTPAPVPAAPSSLADIVHKGDRVAEVRRYSLQARITRAAEKMNLYKIDKGKADKVLVGDDFDIFSLRSDGSIGETIANAKVKSLNADAAVLSITKLLKQIPVLEGYIAKKYVPTGAAARPVRR